MYMYHVCMHGADAFKWKRPALAGRPAEQRIPNALLDPLTLSRSVCVLSPRLIKSV